MSDIETTGDVQRRHHPRRRVLKTASAVLNGRSSTINCLVRDIGQDGARLVFDGPFRPPHDFDLRIPSTRLDRACEVVWRHDNEIGVRFLA